MVTPIQKPLKKNPQLRTRVPTLPSHLRSRTALFLAAAAAEGRFMLQVCGEPECVSIQYPARDACSHCLSNNLIWQEVSPLGKLIATSTVRTSTSTYFKERMPWRLGTVQLDIGPSVICHLHGDVEVSDNVRLINRLDKSGQSVFLAMPLEDTANQGDDMQLRELTCDPKHRRILITDARNPNCMALANQLLSAGASTVFVGEAEGWRPYQWRRELQRLQGVEVVPLDVTDTTSVKELAAEIGGKVDILINNARFVRPGGIQDRDDIGFAMDEMQVNYFGLMRLAQAFAPGMAGRSADGVNCAVAWVNVLSVYSLINSPAFGSFAASNAAAHSFSQCLRAELATSGIRVVNVYTGPTDDEWHQPLPPPKVPANALARELVKALQNGLEDVYVGDVAKDIRRKFMESPKVLEKELTSLEAL
ncbi:SDR family NAD(P)-dependent oxidoreductase [Pseudovibrio sp. Tun.PSC04-5.I4]|uniref:SDR family NAD(P)-dependent oxidoreductase n=1 Tax=Pseudovibrio sp. Tun.PSC04-5.I4 TaxID=1798213 RepID=UPI00088E7609|nr:SDR family NAD(P)-dependent oxidoreductase [Pseudovibrio sp. Tun.PSC04-5.I4]SDQ97230.1 Short-chain dehydrogenase [Pseudovibrio sp. Tun.PSC04-5.I4]